MVPKHIPLTWWQNGNIFTEFQVPYSPSSSESPRQELGDRKRLKKKRPEWNSSTLVCYRCYMSHCCVVRSTASIPYFTIALCWVKVCLPLRASGLRLLSPTRAQGILQKGKCTRRRPVARATAFISALTSPTLVFLSIHEYVTLILLNL